MSALDDALQAGVCPIEGCGKPTTEGHLMCRPHWFMVPRTVRYDVWIAWRRSAGAARTRIPLEELRAVQQKAVDEVAIRLPSVRMRGRVQPD